MPINVQHGVPASPGLAGLAQAAMQIEASRQARLSAGARGGGGSRGGSGGRSGSSGGMSDTFNAAYLKSVDAKYAAQASEQDSMEAAGLQQQEAQLNNENFEFEYTTKQRMQMAQWTNALNDLPNDSSLSPGEQESMGFQLKQRIAGIEKTATLADTNKPPWAGTPEDVGRTWPSETGGVYTRNGDGRVVELTKPSETREGIERAAENKRQEADSKFLDSIGSMLVDDPDSRDGGKIPLSDDAVGKMVKARERGKLTMERIRAEAAGAIDRHQDTGWVDWTEKTMGIKLTTEEISLGETVGKSHALVRELTGAWGSLDQMPPKVQEVFLQAAEIVSNSGT